MTSALAQLPDHIDAGSPDRRQIPFQRQQSAGAINVLTGAVGLPQQRALNTFNPRSTTMAKTAKKAAKKAKKSAKAKVQPKGKTR